MEARGPPRQRYICNCGGPGNPWPHLVARSTWYRHRDASSALAQNSEPAGLPDRDSSGDDNDSQESGSGRGNDGDIESDTEEEAEHEYADLGLAMDLELEEEEEFDINEDDRELSLVLDNEDVEDHQDGLEFAPQEIIHQPEEVELEMDLGEQLPGVIPEVRIDLSGSRVRRRTNRLYNPQPRTPVPPHWPVDHNDQHLLDRRRFNPGRPIVVGDPARVRDVLAHPQLHAVIGNLFAGFPAAGGGAPGGDDSDSSSRDSETAPGSHRSRGVSRRGIQTPSDEGESINIASDDYRGNWRQLSIEEDDERNTPQPEHGGPRPEGGGFDNMGNNIELDIGGIRNGMLFSDDEQVSVDRDY